MNPTTKTAFITGITGFVGKYLSELLIAKGYSVSGLDRWPTCSYPSVDYHEGDILDTATLQRLFATLKPEKIFHLAAVSLPADMDHSPRTALEINIMGTASVLDAVRHSCPSARVLLIGSSKQYSDTIVSDALDETTPCDPTNFYGVSKYMAELLGLQYARQYGLDVRCTRSFNHTGPGQTPRFVCSDWAKQAAEIAADHREPVIQVGDLTPSIDFSDVRDVVRAYFMILDNGKSGEVYNVCSGKSIALKSILGHLIARSPRQIAVKQDASKVRAHKTSTRITGDHSKLTRDTGWQPLIPIEKTLDDLFDYWTNMPNAAP